MVTDTLRHLETSTWQVRDTSRVLSRRPAGRQTVCVADETRYRGGAAIRERREDLGLTQTELAEKAGVSLSSIGRLERGQRIERAKERKVAAALGWAGHGIDAVYRGEPAHEDRAVEEMDKARVAGMELEIKTMSDEDMERIASFVAEVQQDPAMKFELMAQMMRMRAAAESDDAARSESSHISKTSRR